MFMRSERLFLRPGWPEERDELFARFGAQAFADARVCATAPDRVERFPRFLVTLPSAEGSETIGCLDLVAAQRDAEVECWIAPHRRGQGYATEALRAVKPLAALLGHRRLFGRHLLGNAAQGRVLVKAGFRPTGTVQPCRTTGGCTQGYVTTLSPSDRDGDGDDAGPGMNGRGRVAGQMRAA